MGGHAKCLLLMTRGEGGGLKIPKTCLRNTWMFPNWKKLLGFINMQEKLEKRVFGIGAIKMTDVTKVPILSLQHLN